MKTTSKLVIPAKLSPQLRRLALTGALVGGIVAVVSGAQGSISPAAHEPLDPHPKGQHIQRADSTQVLSNYHYPQSRKLLSTRVNPGAETQTYHQLALPAVSRKPEYAHRTGRVNTAHNSASASVSF